jgi:hypothetical protein
VKDAIKIIEKFNKLYESYIKKKNYILFHKKIELDKNSLTFIKNMLQNIEIYLYNTSFEYDNIICHLNTQYNKDMYKLNDNNTDKNNIKKITDYIINLKNKEITPKLLEIGKYNEFMH